MNPKDLESKDALEGLAFTADDFNCVHSRDGQFLAQLAERANQLLRERLEKVLDELVNRFLAWPLPKSVCSDACVTDRNHPHHRSGTSLLTADEARQMLEYVLARLVCVEELIEARNLTKGNVLADIMSPEELAESLCEARERIDKLEAALSIDAVEEYISKMDWHDETPDIQRTIAVGNIRFFAQTIRKRLGME